MANEALESESPIQDGYHHSARARVEAAIDHQQIAMMNARTSHGVAADTQKKSAAGMANQLLIEIDPHVDVVLSWGGKPCGNLVMRQRKAEAFPLESQRLGCLQRYPIHFHRSPRSHSLNSTNVLIAFLLLPGARGLRCAWHALAKAQLLIRPLRCQDCEQVVSGTEQADHCGLMRTVRNSIGKGAELQVILICWRLSGSCPAGPAHAQTPLAAPCVTIL